MCSSRYYPGRLVWSLPQTHVLNGQLLASLRIGGGDRSPKPQAPSPKPDTKLCRLTMPPTSNHPFLHAARINQDAPPTLQCNLLQSSAIYANVTFNIIKRILRTILLALNAKLLSFSFQLKIMKSNCNIYR